MCRRISSSRNHGAPAVAQFAGATPVDTVSKIDESTFIELIEAELPVAASMGLVVESLVAGRVALRAPYRSDSLRPGGTLSGPTMMALADAALYLMVLSEVGLQPLAVTTNLNINFLRKPAPSDLIAVARPLKVGRRLVVGEVTLSSASDEVVVAHATGTYSVPPQLG